LSAERKAYAYFLSPGLGKTAIAITNIGMLCLANKLTGALILSPKGVHRQFAEEQVPEHLDESIKYKMLLWNGTSLDVKRRGEQLTFLSMNLDAVRTKKGYETAEKFLREHDGTSMMVIDESHCIANGAAQRTKACWKLGESATYRRAMTGTPISTHVGNLWSQCKFLDERILGYKYFTGFKNHFCQLGGFQQKQIVGSKNIEELYSLLSHHSFRLTKEEALDLPPKIFVTRKYEMSEICAQHYNNLKNSFLTQLDNGEIVDVNNALTCFMRLQQILSGYLPTGKDNETFEVFSNDRLEQLLDILDQTEGQAVIWTRFTQDILRIEEALNKVYGKGSTVVYYGGNANTRHESLEKFLDKKARWFVSNPSAGGVGLNIVRSGCGTVVYYNNSFNYIHRSQSEDRTHRLGTKGTVVYFDIVAHKSIDNHILRNLKNKKSLESLTLDDIRGALIS
jgi:SNF2 family DNA or RNA helicase